MGALVLELAVEGRTGIADTADRRGSSQAQTGRRLEYGKLAAVDAQGRTLAARLEVPEAIAAYGSIVDGRRRRLPRARSTRCSLRRPTLSCESDAETARTSRLQPPRARATSMATATTT